MGTVPFFLDLSLHPVVDPHPRYKAGFTGDGARGGAVERGDSLVSDPRPPLLLDLFFYSRVFSFFRPTNDRSHCRLSFCSRSFLVHGPREDGPRTHPPSRSTVGAGPVDVLPWATEVGTTRSDSVLKGSGLPSTSQPYHPPQPLPPSST